MDKTITIGEYYISNLQSKYKYYASLLLNYQNSISSIHDFSPEINKRNALKRINTISKNLSALYNDSVQSPYSKSTEAINYSLLGITEFLVSPDDIIHTIEFHKYFNLKNNYINTHKEFLDEPLNKIKENIIELSKSIGFPTLNDAITILINKYYMEIFIGESTDKLHFLCDNMIPAGYSTETPDEDFPDVMIRKPKKSLNPPNPSIDFASIFDNDILLFIKTRKSYIALTGYLKSDPLNIILKTSQISYPFVFSKKKEIESIILPESQNVMANHEFALSYIKNVPLSYILGLTPAEMTKQIEEDYRLYCVYSRMYFVDIMKEFSKDEGTTPKNIKKMFKIIKLLLLKDDNMGVASILFDIVMEDNMKLPNAIYNNLNHNLQLKLSSTPENIKKEIERIKNHNPNDIELNKQIATCKNMPNNVKKAAFDKLDDAKPSNNEYHKQLLYARTLLNFPWPTVSENDNLITPFYQSSRENSVKLLNKTIESLNKSIYGHTECKNSIRELIGKWISNPASSGSAIGLCGPPGVGKTLIARAISNSLDIPFAQITLGGQNDGEILRGHGYTYSGSQPGMIIKKLCEAKSTRCVLYFDELDKACSKNTSGNEIFGILIHMIDPNTNKEFQDNFFQEITFPLDKILFVFSYNDPSLIDKILLDRIQQIDVQPFKLNDKLNIAKQFIIPEMTKTIGLYSHQFIISDEDIEYIIEQYTNEAGIRELKRKIEKIFLKLNIDKIYGKGIFDNGETEGEIHLNRELIIEYLGKNTVQIQKIHLDDMIGVINGLYATDTGNGGILPIQIYNNYAGDEKFTLKLTGSQRKIMRESVISAFTTAINYISEFDRQEYIESNKHGLHIHTPNTSTPKDGPSAGCAFAVAFISIMLNKKIRHDVAMTGEIELTGKITKIGGLQYKLSGAKKAGVKLVLIPRENKDDLDNVIKDYPELILDDCMKVLMVDSLEDVLRFSIVGF